MNAPAPPQILELIIRARVGDRQAQADLLAANVGLVRRVVGRVARNAQPADRDDLLQEAMLALLCAAAGYDPAKAEWSTYAWTAACRRALRAQRRAERYATRHAAGLDAAETAEAGPMAPTPDDPAPTDELLDAVDRLPVLERQLLRLRFRLGEAEAGGIRTVPEVAMLARLSLKRTRKLLADALARLRSALAADRA